MPGLKRNANLFDLLDGESSAVKAPASRAQVTSPAVLGDDCGRMPRAVVGNRVECDDADSTTTGDLPVDPAVGLDGARMRFSLTSTSAAVVVFVALLALAGMFEVGRRWGVRSGFVAGHAAGRESFSAGARDEIEAARRQPPATHLVDDLLQNSAGTTASGAGLVETAGLSVSSVDVGNDVSVEPQWIRDFTYVVAQEFPADRHADASAAQAFLRDHGVDAALVTFSSGAIQLITTQGYNRSDPAQRALADQMLQKVHAVGAQYFASGGGYRLEGYFKTLKNDNW